MATTAGVGEHELQELQNPKTPATSSKPPQFPVLPAHHFTSEALEGYARKSKTEQCALLCCFPFSFPFLIIDEKRKARRAEEEKVARKAALIQSLDLRPKSVPLGPRRRLSQALPSRSPGQNTSIQSSSLFLTRLPLEVRQIIYEYLFSGPTVHIIGDVNRASYARLSDYEPWTLDGWGWQCSRTHHATYSTYVRLFEEPFQSLADILHTCQQVYMEAIDLLYSACKFSICLEDFVHHVIPSTPSQRLASIRHLHLVDNSNIPIATVIPPNESKTWSESLSVLKHMKTLQSLRIDVAPPKALLLYAARPDGVASEIREIFAPLKQISAVEYEVRALNWKFNDLDRNFFADAPFRLVEF